MFFTTVDCDRWEVCAFYFRSEGERNVWPAMTSQEAAGSAASPVKTPNPSAAAKQTTTPSAGGGVVQILSDTMGVDFDPYFKRVVKSCGIELAPEHMANVALLGHSKPKTPTAKARISQKISDHAVANTWWSPSSLPSWLTEDFYIQKIQPQLKMLRVREVAAAMKVSQPYAAFIRSGRRRPHPRHWEALAKLTKMSLNLQSLPKQSN